MTTKRKVSRHRTTKKRIGGGNKETTTAVTAYIKNIAVQILNSIDKSQENFTVTNTRFYNMGDDKLELFKFICSEMNINFERLKIDGGDLINERNKIIHPIKLTEAAKVSHSLITSYGLKEVLSFEYLIINAYVNPRRNVTRSQIHEDGYETQKRKGKTVKNYKTNDIVQPEKVIPTKNIDTSWVNGKSVK